MTLEQLVNERNTIYASMHEAAENPNNSYTARKNLGAILNHDYVYLIYTQLLDTKKQ